MITDKGVGELGSCASVEPIGDADEFKNHLLELMEKIKAADAAAGKNYSEEYCAVVLLVVWQRNIDRYYEDKDHETDWETVLRIAMREAQPLGAWLPPR